MPDTPQIRALRDFKAAYDEIARVGGWKTVAGHADALQGSERAAMRDLVQKGERGESLARYDRSHMALACGACLAVGLVPLVVYSTSQARKSDKEAMTAFLASHPQQPKALTTSAGQSGQ